MTREEAKEILTHNWTRVDNPNYAESELDEALGMAIEALSAEAGMVRCKECEIKAYAEKLVDAFIEDGEELAEAVQGWIPVSERLPSDGRRCLVFYDGPIIGPCIDIMRYAEPLMPNVDVSGKHFYKSDSEWGDIVYDEVVAWMPLPTPYKGGDTE